MNRLFASGGQSIGASGSASVLPMNIQGWFPLGLTGLIFLQSKGLSRVLSSTTVQKHQFFWCSKAFSLLDGPTLTSIVLMMPSHCLILCHPLLLLHSILPTNIQDWFPLGLTGLISLQSKGLPRVFPSPTIWMYLPSLWYNSHIHTWLLEKP